VPRQSSGALSAIDILDTITLWGLRLGAAAVILISGYYIYATLAASQQLFRGMTPLNTVMSVEEFQRHVANMQLLTKVLLLGSTVLVVTALARYYAFPETGAVLLLVGAALFWGMSFIINDMGGPPGGLHKSLLKLGNPREYLKSQFGLAGLGMMGAGVIQLVFHAIILAAGARHRRPKANAEAAKTASQVRKANDQFLGPCWNLPFCRDTDKKLCPIRHSKKPCWRTGRGCYCDQNVILTLSGGNAYAASRGTAGYLSYTASVARPKSLKEKREQCLSCPVYLHHQGQKYKVLAPGVLLGAVALFAMYWETAKNLYPDSMKALGRSLSTFSFGTAAGTVPRWATDLANTHEIMWLLIVVGGLLLIAYLMHGVEWMLYRLGI
jgi:hypothetical protein